MKRVEIDHFAKYHFVSMLRTNSRDTVAFLRKQADLEQNKYRSDIWLLRGGEARPLTGCGDVGRFWWRNEEEIVFPRPVEPKDKERIEKGLPLTVLQSISTTQPGEARFFARFGHEVEDIVFLPDGRFLFVSIHRAQVDAALQQAGGDDDKAAALLERQRLCTVVDELPMWENGEGFASGKRRRLYLYDHGRLTPLVDDKTDVEQLRLAPEKAHAYFVACRFDKVMPLHNRLMRLDLANLETEDVSCGSAFRHTAYAVVDDETLLVGASDMKSYGINENISFYRISLPGRQPQLLYNGRRYDCLDTVGSDLKMSAAPIWVARGGKVYWHSTQYGSSHLMSIDAATGEIAALTQNEGAVMEYQPFGDGFVISALRGLEGPELYALSPTGEETRLTGFNAALAAEYSFSLPQPVAFDNSEGVRIEGWVMKPLGFEEGHNYPAILNIHGGPKTVYGPVLFHEMQYWAAQGFGVLFCNPTGSDGRGDDFADIRGRYGLIDYEDLMTFVDTVLAGHPWIDADRLGVAGGSYGGYMTNWIIGHTGRFAAAVSQRSISNWFSMANTSDIGWYFEPDQAGTDAWSDAAALWEQSPLKYADHVKTPTLFIHSDEDYRCYQAEAFQMYTALQVHGVETRLCLFHGENHELSRSGKPLARIRRLQEITEWFERYLKAED